MHSFSSSKFCIPNIFGTESQYLTCWADGNESGGIFGGQISSNQDGFFHESSSVAYRDWKENESVDQACQDLVLADGYGHWFAEFVSYFVGWDNKMLSEECDASRNRDGGLEIPKEPYRDEVSGGYYHSDERTSLEFVNGNSSWFLANFDFPFGYKEDYGRDECLPPCSYGCKEMQLYEKIFGYWPVPSQETYNTRNSYPDKVYSSW